MAAPSPRAASGSQARRKEGQRVKGMCQLSLALSMRKAIALLEATPASFSLAGNGHTTTPGCKGSWEGSILSVIPDKVRVPLVRVTGKEVQGEQCQPQYYYLCFTDEEATLEKLRDLLRAMSLVSARA